MELLPIPSNCRAGNTGYEGEPSWLPLCTLIQLLRVPLLFENAPPDIKYMDRIPKKTVASVSRGFNISRSWILSARDGTACVRVSSSSSKKESISIVSTDLREEASPLPSSKPAVSFVVAGASWSSRSTASMFPQVSATYRLSPNPSSPLITLAGTLIGRCGACCACADRTFVALQ